MSKQKSRSTNIVQIEREDGITVNLEGKSSVKTAVFDRIHHQRFFLSEQAPICQGMLGGEFGYLALTRAGRKVLNGTYLYDDNFDPGTHELLEECTWIKIYIRPETISDIISRSNWQRRWRKKKESTSSSISGFCFGHYVAGSHSGMLFYFQALKLTLALRHGIYLESWTKGLSLMLEKKPGCTIIEKL